MFILYGTSRHGKVDRVPGLFHVATEFFHIQFLPVIPLGTVLIKEDTGRRIALNWSWKSFLVSYLRVAAILGAAGLAVVALLTWAFEGDITPPASQCALAALAFVIVLVGSSWLTNASERRARQLAKRAGIDPGQIAAYFAGRNR